MRQHERPAIINIVVTINKSFLFSAFSIDSSLRIVFHILNVHTRIAIDDGNNIIKSQAVFSSN